MPSALVTDGAPACLTGCPDASAPLLQLHTSSFKTLQGVKLQDEQAVLLAPRAQAGEASAAAMSTSPLPMLPSISPKLGSPLRFGTSPLSPHSPLSRSFGSAPSWAEDSVVVSAQPGWREPRSAASQWRDQCAALLQCVAGKARGLAGLGKLGNTCFMNSSIQCLAHTVPVMEVFLSGAYKQDLNRENPLSLGGKLATAFADLMAKLWAGGVSYVSPKRFKWALAQFAPQFSGYAQQDSQELLAFLLDGLHEVRPQDAGFGRSAGRVGSATHARARSRLPCLAQCCRTSIASRPSRTLRKRTLTDGQTQRWRQRRGKPTAGATTGARRAPSVSAVIPPRQRVA